YTTLFRSLSVVLEVGLVLAHEKARLRVEVESRRVALSRRRLDDEGVRAADLLAPLERHRGVELFEFDEPVELGRELQVCEFVALDLLEAVERNLLVAVEARVCAAYDAEAGHVDERCCFVRRL